MSWLSSLFPFELPSLALPTFSIPVSIQRRFFGFILRRALGKFLKPGQLESNQIDAQIGSGSIDITELELDDEVSNILHPRLSQYHRQDVDMRFCPIPGVARPSSRQATQLILSYVRV